MERLQQLREDLWCRWRGSFGKLADLANRSRSSERVVYAKTPLFNLKNYTPRKFPAAGRVFLNSPERANSHRLYRLDCDGRPLNMTCNHVVNGFDWQGFYNYTDNDVEYVEFCLQTKVVSEYGRITLHNSLPISYQQIDVNGGGSHLGGRTGKEAMEFISQDSYNYWIQVEEYETSENRIVFGNALTEGLGLSPQRSTLKYSYSDTSRLERIIRHHEDGRMTTEFAAKSKSGLSGLATELSDRIAARAIEALRKAEFRAPLVALELSYRSVSNYVPSVIPATERDSIPNLVLPTVIDPENWIALNEEEFEPEMAEFTERLRVGEQWDLGAKMLRKAALDLTERVHTSLPTAEYFVAFAIDWEFESHELPAILKQCGASNTTLKKLKGMGWLE